MRFQNVIKRKTNFIMAFFSSRFLKPNIFFQCYEKYMCFLCKFQILGNLVFLNMQKCSLWQYNLSKSFKQIRLGNFLREVSNRDFLSPRKNTNINIYQNLYLFSIRINRSKSTMEKTYPQFWYSVVQRTLKIALLSINALKIFRFCFQVLGNFQIHIVWCIRFRSAT